MGSVGVGVEGKLPRAVVPRDWGLRVPYLPLPARSPTRIPTRMQIIETPNAPIPRGHYSQAVVHAGIAYVAGQLPIDPATGEIVAGPARDQAVRTMRNVEAVLKAAGSSLDRILALTIYVTDERHWPDVNAAVAEVLGAHKPSRAIIPISPLRGGATIEIQAIAAAG